MAAPADLDSLASALGFAYFSTKLQPAESTQRFIPLVLTAHSDLYLRPENTYAIAAAEVDPASLLCVDDLPKDRLATLGATFALVDHNRLLPMFGDADVAAVIDHHVDEGHAPSASPRTIRPSGSCASLVAGHFAALLPDGTAVPKGLADLLLSSILIDTGLKPSPDGKATPDDLTAAAWLLPHSSQATASATASSGVLPNMISTDPSLKSLTKLLSEKKLDVTDLSGRDLLRRDYKEYQEGPWRYGLSTVPLALAGWLAKTGATEADKGLTGWALVNEDIRRWMEERELAMAAVLTTFDTGDKSVKKGGLGKHARELLVVVKDDKLENVLEELPRNADLQLGAWRGGDVDVGPKWRVWQQNNVKVSGARGRLRNRERACG